MQGLSNNHKALNAYNINFTRLKQGSHHFQYEIDDSFFELFEASPIASANMNVKVHLEKQSSTMILLFDNQGTIQTSCDRCLSVINLLVNSEQKMIIKFVGSEDGELDEEEDIVYINREADFINIGQFLYENVVLSLPIVKTCEKAEGDQTCDPKMLQILEEGTSVLNSEKQTQKDNDNIDPRWAALAKLKNK
ncbi:MAG: YceD family protein [Chitinophagales bacterium]